MSPFKPFDTDASDNRLTRLGLGLASPLWLPFAAAAATSATFWMMSRWMRGDFAAVPTGAGVTRPSPTAADVPSASDLVSVGAIDAPLPETNASEQSTATLGLGGLGSPDLANDTGPTPAAEPDLAPAKIDRIENYMAHTPPPVEAGRSAPEDAAPPPPVPAEDIMDHTPPSTVEAEGNPAAGREIARAEPSLDPDFLGREPGGKAGLLAETSATVLGGVANFGGDVRAEDAAEASLSPDDEDTIDALADAAYAENLGPVPTAGGAARSRKGKVRPGVAPGR